MPKSASPTVPKHTGHSPAQCPRPGCEDCCALCVASDAASESLYLDAPYYPTPDAAPRPPAFNAAADATLDRAQAVHRDRGGEYGDSWALENMVTTFLDATTEAVWGAKLAPAEVRLMMVAALIDVKDSRMRGDWKLDTVEDGLNYRAAYATWREEYAEARHE